MTCPIVGFVRFSVGVRVVSGIGLVEVRRIGIVVVVVVVVVICVCLDNRCPSCCPVITDRIPI